MSHHRTTFWLVAGSAVDLGSRKWDASLHQQVYHPQGNLCIADNLYQSVNMRKKINETVRGVASLGSSRHVPSISSFWPTHWNSPTYATDCYGCYVHSKLTNIRYTFIQNMWRILTTNSRSLGSAGLRSSRTLLANLCRLRTLGSRWSSSSMKSSMASSTTRRAGLWTSSTHLDLTYNQYFHINVNIGYTDLE